MAIVVVVVLVRAGRGGITKAAIRCANLPPAVYQPANSGDTLPLPKH